MAITNAQQAKQIMNEGEPMRKIKGQNHMLAYITPSEKDILIDLGGQETMTPEGILAYPPSNDAKGESTGTSSNSSNGGGGGRDRDYQQRGASKSDYATTSQSYKDSGTQQVYDGSKNTSPRDSFVPTTPSETPKAPPKKPKKTKDNSTTPNIFKQYLTNNLFTKGLQGLKNSKLAQFNNQKQRESYLNNLQITNPGLYQETIDDLEKLGYYNPDPVEYYGPESKGAARDIEQFPGLYEDQAKSILNTVTDSSDGGVGTLYDDYLDSRNTTTGGGGGGDQQQTDPCLGPTHRLIVM